VTVFANWKGEDLSRENRTGRRLVAALLLPYAALLGWSASQNSPTVDEPGHLAAGISVWESGRFDMYRVNPPLVRAIAAAPLALVGAKTEWAARQGGPHERREHWLWCEFVRGRTPAEAYWSFTIARWACLPLSVIGACVCWRWGRELYGNAAGFLAFLLWCFCPNLFGHGQLITSDVGAAAVGVGVCYFFWRWLRWPDWTSVFFSGVGLGLAELTKFTWILLFVLLPMIWLVWRFGRSPRWTGTDGMPAGETTTPTDGRRVAPRRAREAVQLAAILLLAVFVVNVGYAFDDSFKRLGDYDFVSRAFTGLPTGEIEEDAVGNRFRGTWLGGLPVPLPANYLTGIDLQRLDFEHGAWSYLRGEWRFGGWWYYYLYAMAVKVPLGTWALALLALAATLCLRGYSASWRDELALLVPGAAVLILVSSQTGFNHHMRYLLPAFPFGFIWISKLARALDLATFSRGSFRLGGGWPHRAIAALALAALAWTIISSLSVYPHSLSYFNELAGGPNGGHAHLLDSNIDWGQGLYYLKRWIEAHPEASPIGLAYFGTYPPELAGIEAGEPPPRLRTDPPGKTTSQSASGPRPGWYALSINLVHGCAIGGRTVFPDYTYFRRFQPVATAGYSIYIYHITLEDANRVRRELGRRLPPDPQRAALTELTQTPLALLACPTRSSGRLLPAAQVAAPFNADWADRVAKTDYAINEGDYITDTREGPATLKEGDSGTYAWRDTRKATGIAFQRSDVPPATVRDGLSQTYMIGEKYVTRANYGTNQDPGYDQSAYSGVDVDLNRWVIGPPRPDGDDSDMRCFGSAHPGGCHFVFCDGSIRLISYQIDAEVHRRLGNRQDGLPVDRERF
jgi:prepilin-type processing-associated H-X9-DG protein